MAYVDKINKDNIDYDIQDSKAARSVDGSISSHVEEANQIHTSTGVSESSEFIYRTTAGDASISNGMATLLNVKGKTFQTGHVDESIDVHGDFSASGTTVSIEESTWRTYVADSGIYEFEYDGANWKIDDATVTLANYGLTVTGSVSVNDTITVGYNKLEIGTLTTASPTALVSTGFNQYDATAGYAHVIGNNQYRIDGTYTSLGFTTTIGGTTTPVTVTNGKFTPTEDGYIYVSGGSGDILIALVWSGVRDADPFEAYETSAVTIPTKDAEENNLPTATYGMPSVGDVADELNFSEKKYYQRIGHYTYSAENLATVQAMGVDYWYDLNDIFYVLENSVIYDLASSVSGAYEANDFGTEEFIGTSAPLGATIYYGNNLVDKLRNLLDIQSLGPGLSLVGSELRVISGSGVKLLTENDYDYPDANPTGVALWRLQPGLYILPWGVKGYTGVWFSADVARTGTWLVTTGSYGSDPAAGLFYFFGGEQIFRYTTKISNGNRLQGETIVGGIRDNLYSNDRTYALSAYQGKVLDGKIEGRVKQNAGAPTTSTVGTKGQLLEDTTNGKLYICTDATNPYVWEEVGAGGGPTVVQTTGTSTTDVMSQKAVTDAIAGVGGGITELTTADYNYPTDNPSCVAFWLLEPGIYSWSGDVAFRANSSWTDQTNSPGTGIIWDAGDGQLGMAFDFKGNGHWYQLANSTTGQSNWANRGLLNTDVYQGGNFSNVRIGYSTTSSGTRATAIGRSASATATDAIVIGTSANTSSTSATDAIVIGNSATTGATRAIAIGKDAQSTASDGIVIGNNVKSGGIAIGRNIPLSSGIVIGNTAEAHGTSAVSIGLYANASAGRGIAIGESAEVATGASFGVALGAGSKVTQQGEVGIGLGSGSTYGYNDSNYRLLTGLYDGQSAHDAATYGQVVSYAAINGAGAPTTATEGRYVGQLYLDTTNENMYFLKTIDTTTTPATYTWVALGGGGSSTTIQTTTDGVNYSDVPSLLLAGSNSVNFPYAFPTRRDGNVQEWGYIRPVLGFSTISSAYVGGYEHDGDEDLWRGKQETRLALYSDIHDATLTIQQNGATVDTFSANASTNKTVNIETPVTFTTNEWNALWA